MFAIKTAEAEALATEIVAKAEAEARHLEGRGAARMNYEIMRGMSSSTSGFGSSVDGSETKVRGRDRAAGRGRGRGRGSVTKVSKDRI